MSDEKANASNGRKPRIGITMGDPAGIGPEISIKAALEPAVLAACEPMVIGDAASLRPWVRELRSSENSSGDALAVIPFGRPLPATIDTPVILDMNVLPGPVDMGREQAMCGHAAAEYIRAGVAMCLSGDVDAIVTAPINKKALHLAGLPYPGHTEFLAELSGTRDFAMTFFSPSLRVGLLTTHVALADVPGLVTREGIERLIRLIHREMLRLGFPPPRIAVAALNPHGGEGMLFGREEALEMAPAIAACRSEDGIDVSGPHSGDTIFARAARGEFDFVLSCYHDQGLIPIKCLSFGESVNVTLGLPFIRTSVDHGTAFDIAGQGRAEHGSMMEAIRLAAELAERKRLSAN